MFMLNRLPDWIIGMKNYAKEKEYTILVNKLDDLTVALYPPSKETSSTTEITTTAAIGITEAALPMSNEVVADSPKGHLPVTRSNFPE
jgi:hypothetical protein